MLTTLAKKIPQIAALVAERDALRVERDALVKRSGFVPAGHFYSPIVAIDEAKRDESRLFGEIAQTLPGIDMNDAAQLRLLARFEELYPSIDFPATKAPSHRYHYENDAYLYSDAIFLHCMMREFKPRRIIEVGSGHSSCVMLDTSEKHLGGSVDFTFIEPYPQLLRSLIRDDDLRSVKIIPERLQDVALQTFSSLGPGDFLFIDSTHVSKTGSDVNRIFSEILPAIGNGVFVHFHDIFWPFEYPKDWVYEGRSWNEIYVLRAFLQFNRAFRVEIMNTYLEHFHRERFAAAMPLCLKNLGGSIWLRKHSA